MSTFLSGYCYNNRFYTYISLFKFNMVLNLNISIVDQELIEINITINFIIWKYFLLFELICFTKTSGTGKSLFVLKHPLLFVEQLSCFIKLKPWVLRPSILSLTATNGRTRRLFAIQSVTKVP